MAEIAVVSVSCQMSAVPVSNGAVTLTSGCCFTTRRRVAKDDVWDEESQLCCCTIHKGGRSTFDSGCRLYLLCGISAFTMLALYALLVEFFSRCC
jgi:hypothetical protein